MIGVNVSLGGIFGYVLSTELSSKYYVGLALCLAGAFVCIWGLYVLARLWHWHDYWRQAIIDIEAHFPLNVPRPFSGVSSNVARNSNDRARTWFKTYTQPFFIIITIVWLILAVFCINQKMENPKEKNLVSDYIHAIVNCLSN